MEAKKKLSGSGYRKQAKIKKLKHDALIKNCRKLDSMFKPSTNSSKLFLFLFLLKYKNK